MGEATSLATIYLYGERIGAANVLLGQFSVYMGKNFWIFVLKLRRFD